MNKSVPLREQVIRACLTSGLVRDGHTTTGEYIMSGCFCHQHTNNNLEKCDKCVLRYKCYTMFRVGEDIKNAPVTQMDE